MFVIYPDHEKNFIIMYEHPCERWQIKSSWTKQKASSRDKRFARRLIAVYTTYYSINVCISYIHCILLVTIVATGMPRFLGNNASSWFQHWKGQSNGRIYVKSESESHCNSREIQILTHMAQIHLHRKAATEKVGTFGFKVLTESLESILLPVQQRYPVGLCQSHVLTLRNTNDLRPCTWYVIH